MPAVDSTSLRAIELPLGREVSDIMMLETHRVDFWTKRNRALTAPTDQYSFATMRGRTMFGTSVLNSG
jgi:hypothetical protein